MTTDEMLTDEAPANWDVVEKAAASTTDFLKFKSGEKVRLRILTGPFAFGQIYAQNGEKKMSVNVPFGTSVPGHKPRTQYAFEVLVLDGPQAGAHKLWTAGQKVAEQLKEIKASWGDITKADVVVGKKGEGLQTEWSATAAPPQHVEAGLLVPMFNLREKVKFAGKDEIMKLPPAEEKGGKITPKQVEFISKLATAKDMSAADVSKISTRKFNKGELDDLTQAEASALIDTLKSL